MACVKQVWKRAHVLSQNKFAYYETVHTKPVSCRPNDVISSQAIWLRLWLLGLDIYASSIKWDVVLFGELVLLLLGQISTGLPL